jgi:hypothetical protein
MRENGGKVRLRSPNSIGLDKPSPHVHICNVITKNLEKIECGGLVKSAAYMPSPIGGNHVRNSPRWLVNQHPPGCRCWHSVSNRKMSNASPASAMTGVLAGPVSGLRYRSASQSGMTNERGEFGYCAGESVTFHLGGFVLGSAAGAPRITLAHLVNSVGGNIDKLHSPVMTNLARLVQSLDRDGATENGVSIAPAAHGLIGPGFINYNQGEIEFEADPAVVSLFAKLNAAAGVFRANIPRKLTSAAAARY